MNFNHRIAKLRQHAFRIRCGISLKYLQKQLIEINNYHELKKVFGWLDEPILERPDIYDYDYIEDINERRIRDAESLATVVKNLNPRAMLEIGTANGMGTVLMAANAPDATIFTVNIPPEEIRSGKGGLLTTAAFQLEDIGIEFKKRKLANVKQILANTATWQPDIGTIDIAYIDGCHDSDFVYNDTLKVLGCIRPGGMILWHDFNPEMISRFGWIKSVCFGIEKLYRDGHLKGPVFHIRDSWVGIYQVPF